MPRGNEEHGRGRDPQGTELQGTAPHTFTIRERPTQGGDPHRTHTDRGVAPSEARAGVVVGAKRSDSRSSAARVESRARALSCVRRRKLGVLAPARLEQG